MANESGRAGGTPGYDIFLSYSHATDRDLAPDLQRGLARLAKPWNQPRALRVFRDDTDLSVAHALTDEIECALERSRYFLLLASPLAARSEWVGREIEYWKENKSPETFLIAVTAGKVAWAGTDFDWSVTDALPPIMSDYFASEPLWADLTFARDKDRRSLSHSGFRSAVASLAARPRGLSKDQLDSDDVRQHRITTRLRRAAVAGLVVLLLVSTIAGLGFLMQRNEAREQRDRAIVRELISDSDRLAGTDPAGSRFDSLAAYRMNASPQSHYAVLSAAANRMIGRFSAHAGPVQSVAFDPKGETLATADGDYRIRLWSVRTGRQIGDPLSGHTYTVTAIAFSGDGSMLVSVGNDGKALVWNVQTHRAIGESIPATPAGTYHRVPSVAFSSDSRTLAITGADGKVRLWDVITREQIGAAITGGSDDNGWVAATAFSHDGKTLATAGLDRVARLWDVQSRREIGQLIGHTREVNAVMFSKDGKTLATSGVDGTARLWDIATAASLGEITSRSAVAPAVALRPDGKALATGGFSGNNDVQWWDAATVRQIGTSFSGHAAGVNAVAFSPDGELLASAGLDGDTILWDVANRRPTGDPMMSQDGWIWATAFSPRDRTLATANANGVVHLFDPDSRRERGRPLATRIPVVRAIAFSPDGATLAAVGDGREVRFWDVTTQRDLDLSITTPAERIWAIAYSPDGKTLATAGADRFVRLWDVATRKEKSAPLAVAADSLAFTPDGRQLAVADSTKRVRFWDVETLLEDGAPLAFSGRIQSLSFSPNGRVLATAGDGVSARLWDVATRRQIGAPLSAATFVLMERVAFDPNGRSIAVAQANETSDSQLRLWDVAFSVDPADYLCGTSGASFTADEWAARVPAGPPARALCR